MTTHDTGRTARLAAMRAALRQEREAHEAAAHTALPTDALYRGAPWCRGRLTPDLVLWIEAAVLRPLRQARQTRSLAADLERLRDDVSPGNAMIAASTARALLQEPVLLPAPVDMLVSDSYMRCAYGAWCLGSLDAAPHVAGIAYRLAADTRSPLHRVRYMQAAMAALASTAGPISMGPRDRAHDLGMTLQQLHSLSYDVRDVVDAIRADDDAVTDHVKGQLRKLPRLSARIEAESTVEPAGLDDAEDFMLERAVLEPVPAQPGTLVVIPSLAHLPQGRSERSAPRQEFGHMEGQAIPLVPVPDLTQAAAVLHQEFPWMAELTDRVLEDLAGKDSAVLSASYLVVGPPGGGKSSWVRRMSEVLALPLTVYQCGGSADGTLAGTSRAWSSGRACVALQAIRRAKIANPMLCLDELDKASGERRNGSLLDAVLALAEPTSRKAFNDPYLECGVDLSAINLIATANQVDELRGPVLDRFVILEAGQPSPEHADAIIAGLLREAREASGRDPRWIPDLEPYEWDVLGTWRGGSIRPLKRALARLLSLRQSPGIVH